jgi:hypothetical protein
MFTYSERDMHRMPAPAKTHLPIKPEISSSGVMEDDVVGRESEVSKGKLVNQSTRLILFLFLGRP